MKELYFCVTSELSYDQRMMRICSSLQDNGYHVTLVGRKSAKAPPLPEASYRQVRLPSRFGKGKLMYLEYNLRLLFFLLFRRVDLFVSIDLDTIIPVYLASVIKGKPRVHDAHEWFSEMKEVITRPPIQRAWSWVERNFLPRFPHGYTVSASIANAFREKYNLSYEVILNTPPLLPAPANVHTQRIILYQGAVNEGRCLEWLIPAMKDVNAPLWICGEGNFSAKCRDLIRKHGVEEKVLMKGYIPPAELRAITLSAYAGINLVEPIGMNQVYSLANKFFDYIHAGIPQLTMNFPEYERINRDFEVAVLTDSLEPQIIAAKLNNLLENEVLYATLKQNCRHAAEHLNWQLEEQKLLRFYMKMSG
jgi:glycosyltransferase involved in cell wall biosynthesis